ncbi:MAG TPA: DegV family protein [Candidatus Limnocylindrales bacterium]
MSIMVVTDSTACLPEIEESGRVTVVPIHVVMRGVSGREGLEIGPEEVANALAERTSVSTSQPTPGEFAAVYSDLFAAGATGIVSIHLAAELSGTFSCAQLAAGQVDGPVEVIDSQSTAMGLGFAALAAGRAAVDGLDISGVREAAVGAIPNISTFFYVDTLEHLRRGGRITAVSALLGTALAVKPLLEVVDGKIVLRDKVRTAARALDRLAALAVEAAGSGRVELGVHHLAAAERAEYLVDTLKDRLGDRVEAIYTSEVGAAVGAHVGPGLAGVVVHRL